MKIRVYTVTPLLRSTNEEPRDVPFLGAVTRAARATEAAGWDGILVPHSFHDVDPWLVAGCVGAVTERLEPLVAVQPVSVPPHTVAAFATCFAALYQRPVHLNFVAGARDDEMRRVGDTLTHDQRYARIASYGKVIRSLLHGEPVTGSSYGHTFDGFSLDPRQEGAGACRVFIAGSSTASIAAAVQCADVVVTHPLPLDDWLATDLVALQEAGFQGELAIRIGIVSRSSASEAWELARSRFPATRRGRRETVFKTRSPSVWSRNLAQLAIERDAGDGSYGAESDVYWLGGFASGRVSSPFLVGSHDDVAETLAAYLKAGVSRVLVNGIYDDDYNDARLVIDRAADIAGRPRISAASASASESPLVHDRGG